MLIGPIQQIQSLYYIQYTVSWGGTKMEKTLPLLEEILLKVLIGKPEGNASEATLYLLTLTLSMEICRNDIVFLWFLGSFLSADIYKPIFVNLNL